jgi:hypothetical protein
MEFSADRAGLLCCQDLDTAHQAMLRDLHGLPIDSPWLKDVKFDPAKYLREIEYWERKSLVAFIQNAKQFSSATPFVRERIAVHSDWARRGSYREILSRSPGRGPDPNQLVTIKAITIRDAADNDADLNPYCVVHLDNTKWFETGPGNKLKSATWNDLDETRLILDNPPIFVEIWHYRWGTDPFVGGFVVYPKNPTPGKPAKRLLRAPLEWDWKQRTTTSRQGLAEVVVEFSSRAK